MDNKDGTTSWRSSGERLPGETAGRAKQWRQRQNSGLPPRRLMWLFAIKLALLAFAVLVALQIYGLI